MFDHDHFAFLDLYGSSEKFFLHGPSAFAESETAAARLFYSKVKDFLTKIIVVI